MEVNPPTDGAGLVAAVESLSADLRSETDSVLKYKELIGEAEKVHSKATAKYDARTKGIKEVKRYLKGFLKSGKATPEQAAAVEAKLAECEASLRTIEEVRPTTGSVFVRLFLGKVNVKAMFNKDRSLLRDEYEKFKSRTNYGFLLFPAIWLATYLYLRHTWRYTHWIHILTHVWMLYYYVSLSLRENILRVNGSNIRPWWIYHHYLSAFMSIIVLTWPPDSVSWNIFTPVFTAYFWYQGGVQFVQAWYQKRRHYVLRAMGKARSMDVSHTETLTEFHAGLYLIVALVFIAQAWQLWIGWALLQTLVVELDVSQPWYDFREEVQAALLGVCFLVLGCTNFATTVQTLLDKSSKSKQRAAGAGQEGGAGGRRASPSGSPEDGRSRSVSVEKPPGTLSGAGAAGAPQHIRTPAGPGGGGIQRTVSGVALAGSGPAASPTSAAASSPRPTSTGLPAGMGSPLGDATLLGGISFGSSNALSAMQVPVATAGAAGGSGGGGAGASATATGVRAGAAGTGGAAGGPGGSVVQRRTAAGGAGTGASAAAAAVDARGESSLAGLPPGRPLPSSGDHSQQGSGDGQSEASHHHDE